MKVLLYWLRDFAPFEGDPVALGEQMSDLGMAVEDIVRIGDACLFANMLLFQLIWNLVSFAGLGAPSGVVDAVARLLILCFLALLLYFPPRMFYLIEDAGKARTWVMILVANAPVMARLLFGSSALGH